MKKIIQLSLVCLFVISACKKDNPTPSENTNNNGGAQLTCKYDTVYSSQMGVLVYEYDDLGRVSKVTRTQNGTEITDVYTYSEGKVLVQNSAQTNQFFLNENGFADTVYMELNTLGSIQIFYTYNSQNQIIRQIQEMEINGNEIRLEVENYYLNGNNTSSKLIFNGDESVMTNEYHLDKPNMFKEMEQKTQFIPTNQNLIKVSYVDGDSSQSFTYQFDAQNKVISRKISLPDNTYNTETFVWKCK